MRLKVERGGEGLHPSEAVVTIRTRGGEEEVVVDPRSIENDSLNVGWPVGREGNYFLVELPRPTSGGHKRVWVEKGELIPDIPERAIA